MKSFSDMLPSILVRSRRELGFLGEQDFGSQLRGETDFMELNTTCTHIPAPLPNKV